MKKAVFLLLPVLTLLACSQQSKPDIPPPYSFARDSWEVVNEVAKGGLDNLIKVYHPKGDTFIIQKDDDEATKISKTRKIHVDGIGVLDVRVIGEEHDVTSNGVTALTFEVVSILHSVAYNLETTDINEWSTSHLRKFLNNQLVSLLTPALKDAIKPVKKKTLDKKTGKVETLEEKLFPLSYTELGGVEDDSHVKEGAKYEYYDIHSESQDRVKDPDFARSSDQRYWLRSPAVDSNLNCNYVNEYGRFSIDDICIQLSVAPAFCI